MFSYFIIHIRFGWFIVCYWGKANNDVLVCGCRSWWIFYEECPTSKMKNRSTWWHHNQLFNEFIYLHLNYDLTSLIEQWRFTSNQLSCKLIACFHLVYIERRYDWLLPAQNNRHNCFKSGKFVTVLWSSWNFTDAKRGFEWMKVCYREHALAYPQTHLRTCGGPKAFVSTRIFERCDVKLAQEGRNATSCKPIRNIPVSPINDGINFTR